MSDESPQARRGPRPSVVTLSCVFVAVTAFLTLTELITALMDWASVDMQASIRPLLRQFAAAGVAVSMTEVLRYLRWFFLAMVPFSVAAMVFAVYALRGDRRARVMTTILAVVAGFLSLPIGVLGVLQASMLMLAAGALWSPDAGRWYRGEPAAAPPAAEPTPALPASPMQIVARPTSVMTAGLLTIFGSLAAGAFASLYLVVSTFARDEYIAAVKTGPFGGMFSAREIDLMMTVMFWASVGILPLALTGLLGAVALLARRRVGRTTTLCWAWVTAVLGLAMLPVGLLATAGAGAVIALLARDDARQWTAPR